MHPWHFYSILSLFLCPLPLCPSSLGTQSLHSLTSADSPWPLVAASFTYQHYLFLPSQQPNRTSKEDTFCLILRNECIIAMTCQGFFGPQPASSPPHSEQQIKKRFQRQADSSASLQKMNAKDRDPAPPSVWRIWESMLLLIGINFIF